ncbi:hypothetical protein FALBO_16953 [Fusarium albosuccineum]|uniref:Uncharacterized protein n=1 Tax=Fusarium albosuccineum TaxID=1237068 RepID=A0A8H4KE42_9HYPO|nr:hypothetical protein FALBO_16953 [Fusarium albosuccineum]
MASPSVSSPLGPALFLDHQQCLNVQEKEAYILSMWKSAKPYSSFLLSAYFVLLQHERRIAANDSDPESSLLEFRDILTIRDGICKNYEKERGDLCNLVESELRPELALSHETTQDVIILVVRLLLLVRVEFRNNQVYASPNQLQMSENQTLQSVLAPIQSGPPLRDWNVRDEFPSWFNVIDLGKKAGLRIGWADYITDHLRIQSGTLLLFRNVEALKYIEQSETLHDYLEWDLSRGGIEDWYRLITKDCEESHISRLYQDYPVWHQHLAYVHEVSKNQGDWSLKRCWYDDRDESLWWTRWALIAAVFLAILFGLIQSITGIIQVIYAGRS